ncbi:DUF692 domain-containing protein [Pseudomonas cannabina]|uniref:DUF692 domain-containing protein n=1 Tax=Pseudomonas cannabina TaxID=86840 RepID=A0A0P9KF79_PSECA|nr:DUF692 family multinuclear iron-containing protein [Pseudomonas cannabina]KAA8718704.1 DUF692 domain-containing protein [Pseudomonas cannabina]KPW63458.1 Uncharacterized protein ALO81_01889 [Pseudomonas cannabina]RMN16203.1 hypothetical protein ALQ64_01400 [Pseudomonas cannabina]SDR12957.1 hypothetical protein SAMN05216597_2425 [Pseudomonas cannabina]
MPDFVKPAPIGVGIQYNPEILDWFPFEDIQVDILEILLDNIMAPMDGPQIIKPSAQAMIERLGQKFTLLAHSNYGCDFGFSALEETAAVQRHVPLAKMLNSPWVANHCFYGDQSWLDIWSSPIQFSAAEVARCADRAQSLQALYGMPLAHENAAYYLECPGAEMREAEFLARLVQRSGTFLHLDLHNIYTNHLNLKGFDLKDYMDTLPLDKVISVHLAGGSWHGGLYHDWHDACVPEPVWDLYEDLLSRAQPSAVILEYQGQAHHAQTRIMDASDESMIVRDVQRAQAIWNRYNRHPQERQYGS